MVNLHYPVQKEPTVHSLNRNDLILNIPTPISFLLSKNFQFFLFVFTYVIL